MSRQPPARNDRFEDYVPVAERIEQFYSRFSEGRVMTHIAEHDRESGFVLIRAEIYRHADDAVPAATGHAYEYKDSGHVQKTSYIEVAETSAVGRALALLGFEVRRGIASREEMQKAARKPPDEANRAPALPPPAPDAAADGGAEDLSARLDREILQSAGELGYDAAKVRRWVNQKFKVTEGLEGLPPDAKREVLKIFREQVIQNQTKET
ncbi:MAG: hypothetical protein ACRD9R_12940 [Pyrinomonadaceae bacterium]